MKGKTSAKAELRSKLRSILRNLPLSLRDSESQAIRDQLIFPPGSKIALFAGISSEVQLLDLLSRSPEVLWFLPRVTGASKMEFLLVDSSTPLTKGSFGILEPSQGTSAQDLDAIICPGLAFTRQGDRLGQGGGFYDRALADFPSAQLIGVCLQCQVLDALPTEAHDQKMDRLITPLQEL